MKKKLIITCLLAIVLIFGLSACGGGGGSAEDPDGGLTAAFEKYGVDTESNDDQAMSEDRCTTEELITVWEWYNALPDAEKDELTYNKWVEQFGMDASDYALHREGVCRFNWRSSENSIIYIQPYFNLNEDGEWKMANCNSNNLPSE